MNLKLKIEKLKFNAVIPQYASAGAACFDLHAIGVPEGGVSVTQDSPQRFHTGLAFEVPVGWVMLISSRSGHGFNADVRLSNCEGVIDSDYRGEVQVKLAADGDPFVVKNGDRIAQARLAQCPQFEFEVVSELSVTERGSGGFGSTGTSKAII